MSKPKIITPDPERLRELQAVLSKLDPQKRLDWRLEVYTRRDNQDYLSQVIDLKTCRPVTKKKQAAELSENG
jgi:hypothetical protein